MSEPIKARNLSAQLHYRAAGNPPTTLASSAISNCFPGLEFDLRNLWRRLFQGILLHEADNLVVAAEDPGFRKLVGHRLIFVEECPMFIELRGPTKPGGADVLLTGSGNGVAALEWSNAMASVLERFKGTKDKVRCRFTKNPAWNPIGPMESSSAQLMTVRMHLNNLFYTGPDGEQAVINDTVVLPGELTQSLCSPWQNDYRECACYYWAASRPDFVNVEQTGPGKGTGNNWLAKDVEHKEYVVDSAVNQSKLWTYDELFRDWQRRLSFIVGGRDAEE